MSWAGDPRSPPLARISQGKEKDLISGSPRHWMVLGIQEVTRKDFRNLLEVPKMETSRSIPAM